MDSEPDQAIRPHLLQRWRAKLTTAPAWAWLALLFIASAALRFWRLDQFNVLVFDEVHFARFANDYLTNTKFFENHPPLGKYFIAAGIWLSQFHHFDTTNNLLGRELPPFGYRWMNALMGSFVPLVTAGVAWQITGKKRVAVIAGLFAFFDGMTLVESRYALVNIYILLFGLLGQYLFLAALQKTGRKKVLWLFLAALGLGASFSVKWSGLAFLLGVLALFAFAKLAQWRKVMPAIPDDSPEKIPAAMTPSAWSRVGILAMTGVLIIAIAFYSLIWIPHLIVNDNMGFWGWHQYMLDSQSSVGENIHPYCSRWYTWPVLKRPVAYYFHADMIAPGQQVFTDVHAIGNPALVWMSSLVMLVLSGFFIQRFVLATSSLVSRSDKKTIFQSPRFWIAFYLIVNYAANLLPWLGINRCTFYYHYLPASYFALLGLAWLLGEGTTRPKRSVRLLSWLCIGLVAVCFLYFLPIYLGLPLPSKAFYNRMWFRSWI